MILRHGGVRAVWTAQLATELVQNLPAEVAAQPTGWSKCDRLHRWHLRIPDPIRDGVLLSFAN